MSSATPPSFREQLEARMDAHAAKHYPMTFVLKHRAIFEAGAAAALELMAEEIEARAREHYELASMGARISEAGEVRRRAREIQGGS